MSAILSVSQLNFYLRSVMAENENLQPILIRGEVSACRSSLAGHLYFTLTDGSSSISCVAFARTAARLKQQPVPGAQATVQANVEVSERNSAVQLIVLDYLPVGTGKKTDRRSDYLSELRQRGALSEERKKPLPALPLRIGLITAQESAALADFTTVCAAEYPIGQILFCPATVQGETAPASIAAAMERLDKLDCDLLVCTRGGGAREDLEAFDDPLVIETALGLKTPLMSGVGHETDVSLLDLVADLRVPTPTAAAKWLGLQLQEQKQRLARSRSCLNREMKRTLAFAAQRKQQLEHLRVFVSLRRMLEPAEEQSSARKRRFARAMTLRLKEAGRRSEQSRTRLTQAMARRLQALDSRCLRTGAALSALGPMETLKRGYAIPVRSKGGRLTEGEALRLIFAAQEANVQITAVSDRRTETGEEPK